MKILFRTSGVEFSSAEQTLAERKLQFALSNFARHFQRVNVFLSDVNGAKGGEDKLCRIVLHLRRQPSLVIEERACDILPVIDLAAERAGQVLGRKVERRRAPSSATSMSGESWRRN
ncbi:MAG: HPF/RaiA family ribosome-associated protein [Pirellulales bacterium]|nr:HPF/RaiA family ribosome-associated protein [Pirellulales bacterium]